MRSRENQRLHHQEGIVAAWGNACFTHYGWRALPLPLLRQLHDLAVLMPRWADAVDLLNAKMLARHELRVVRGNNKALRVGEHSAASKVQHQHSPVERSDIVAALEWAEKTGATSDEARNDISKAARFIGGLPIGHFGLCLDAFGMVVPSSLSEDDNEEEEEENDEDDDNDDDIDNDDDEEEDGNEDDEDDDDYDDDNIHYGDDPGRFARPTKRVKVLSGTHDPPPIPRNTLGEVDDREVVSRASERAQGVTSLDYSEAEQGIDRQEVAGSEERNSKAPNINNEGNFHEGGSLPRTSPTLLQSLQTRHGMAVQRLVDELNRPHLSDDIMHRRRLQLDWLGQQRWARIYAEPEHRLGRSCVAASASADVWYLSWEVFRNYAENGYVFPRPVVIKQDFQDSGEYDIADYVDSLWQRFPQQQIDVQNNMTGETSSISVSQYCLAVTEVDLDSSSAAAAIGNATNLGRLARADEPLLKRMPRFRLLSTLAERIAGTIGRSEPLIDVQGCFGFNLLCFAGAFSGSYVDPLLGSWTRCLSGVQIAAIATDLEAEDWQAFSHQGRRWSPRRQGGGLLIALEQDDVLLMPPGLRIIRATFAPSPYLAEGGMLWDECNIPATLEGLLYMVNNHAYTDGPQGVFQLSTLIDELESWLDDENYVHRPLGLTTAPEHSQTVKAGIRALRASLRLPP